MGEKQYVIFTYDCGFAKERASDRLKEAEKELFPAIVLGEVEDIEGQMEAFLDGGQY